MKEKYHKLKGVIATIAFAASIIIGFLAMFLPPQGIIDNSILWWTSQCLLFSATLLGIDVELLDFGRKNKRETQIQLND